MKRLIFAIAGILLLAGAYLLGSWHGFSAGLGKGMEFVRQTHLRGEFWGLYDDLSSRNPAPQTREYLIERIYYLSTVLSDKDIGLAAPKDFDFGPVDLNVLGDLIVHPNQDRRGKVLRSCSCKTSSS